MVQGLGIRGTARVFEVDPNTVLHWLTKAAEQLRAFAQYFLHDLHLTQVQLDELYAVLSALKEGTVREEEAIERLSRSPQWVWAAIDPESKCLLTIDVGERSGAMAQRVVHQVVQVWAPGCVPLFLTDGFKEYATALLAHFGEWVQPPRRQALAAEVVRLLGGVDLAGPGLLSVIQAVHLEDVGRLLRQIERFRSGELHPRG